MSKMAATNFATTKQTFSANNSIWWCIAIFDEDDEHTWRMVSCAFSRKQKELLMYNHLLTQYNMLLNSHKGVFSINARHLSPQFCRVRKCLQVSEWETHRKGYDGVGVTDSDERQAGTSRMLHAQTLTYEGFYLFYYSPNKLFNSRQPYTDGTSCVA